MIQSNLNNSLVKLGKCVKCKRPMTPEDFTNVAMLRFYEPIKYFCISCIEDKTAPKAGITGKIMLNDKDMGLTVSSGTISASWNDVTVGKIIDEINNFKYNKDIACSICGRQSENIADFVTKQTEVVVEGETHVKKYHYCDRCVKEFGIDRG